jgi:hypothetical protein
MRILSPLTVGLIVPPGPRIYRTALRRPRQRLRADAALAAKLGEPGVSVLRRRRGTNPEQGGPKRYKGLKPCAAFRTSIFGKNVPWKDRYQGHADAVIPSGVKYARGVYCEQWQPYGKGYMWREPVVHGGGEDPVFQNQGAINMLTQGGIARGPDSDFLRFCREVTGRGAPVVDLVTRWVKVNGVGPRLELSRHSSENDEEWEEWESDDNG